jgi:hypothetical protein
MMPFGRKWSTGELNAVSTAPRGMSVRVERTESLTIH